MRPVTGATRVLGIIGSPVEHSLSPLMQNAALAELGLDFVYVPFHVRSAVLAEAVKGLRSLQIHGFNVTIPHKEAIVPLLDEISPEASAIGAVNTVQRTGDRLVGYNTDAPGLLKALVDELAFSPVGKRILLLGAGGAARAAGVALIGAGAASLTIANRSQERGEELVANLEKSSGAALSLATLDLLGDDRLAAFDLIVNSTSVGMHGTTFDKFAPALLKTDACVYDMVYAPAETPFLAATRLTGRRGANGLGMLAAQGEIAFSIWTGRQPPPGLMRNTLLLAVKD